MNKTSSTLTSRSSTETETDQRRRNGFLKSLANPKENLALFYHRTARGTKLRFSNRPWLKALYEDTAEKKVLPKASRLGISEYLFVENFALAIKGNNGMFILPTEPIRNRVISGRIDKMVSHVQLYRDNIGRLRKDVDSK